MGKTDFVATESWFYRWNKCKNICFTKLHGEQAETDNEGAHSWLRTKWLELLMQCSPANVFKVSETGFYFQALPEHTFILKNDIAKDTKISKECLTVLCYASPIREMLDVLDVLSRGIQFRAEGIQLHYQYEHFIFDVIKKFTSTVNNWEFFPKKIGQFLDCTLFVVHNTIHTY